MSNFLIIQNKIKDYNKTISVSGDKSISIRWVLFSSIANGVSRSQNLLKAEDGFAAIDAVKKLGVKVKLTKKNCLIYGKGIDGYSFRKNLKIDAKNSGTLGRLILGLLINSTKTIELIGDKSLSKRDFKRIAEPLSKFGAKFKLNSSILPNKSSLKNLKVAPQLKSVPKSVSGNSWSLLSSKQFNKTGPI